MNLQSINPHFITDTSGNKISVVLSMDEFKAIMEELEDIDDVRSYDEAKKGNLDFIEAIQAFEEIENKPKMKINVQSSH